MTFSRTEMLLYEGHMVLCQLFLDFYLAQRAPFHGGHSGIYRTYRRIAANLFWFGMKNFLQQFVR